MTTFAGLCTAAATYGMGVHVQYLTIDEIATGIKILVIGQSVVSLAMGISKVAVVVFLMRILVKKWWDLTLISLVLSTDRRTAGIKCSSGSGSSP